MFDLSNLKTWADGFWAVINAPHILGPLLLVVAIVVWWFRGSVEKARRDGLQSNFARDGAGDCAAAP